MPGIIGYADDSTVVESYVPDTRANSPEIQIKWEAMVLRQNLRIKGVSYWGYENRVNFNAVKTHACLFSA